MRISLRKLYLLLRKNKYKKKVFFLFRENKVQHIFRSMLFDESDPVQNGTYKLPQLFPNHTNLI